MAKTEWLLFSSTYESYKKVTGREVLVDHRDIDMARG